MITVLFNDKDDNYYFGEKENGKFTGFNLFLVPSLKTSKQLAELVSDLELNEFMVVDITKTTNNDYKIDPIVSGALSASDSEEEIAPPLCDMGRDKLLDVLNKLLPEKYLND